MKDPKDPKEPKIIVALDYNDKQRALDFIGKVHPDLCKLKVGIELFTEAGPDFVRKLVDDGYKVFLDLKYFGIPSTVAKACEAAARLGVWVISVQASGGPEMLRAAAGAIYKFDNRPKLLGVTVLTSMDKFVLSSIGVGGEPCTHTLNLSRLAKESGLDGVIAAAQDVSIIKRYFGYPFMCITPGIRPSDLENDDQKRIMTPAQAMDLGSDYLVIGRPITGADDPVQALEDINLSIQKRMFYHRYDDF